MKKNRKLRKALLVLCSAVALVAISVTATLAYLSDSEAVTNVFTVGKVGIELNETDVDNDKDTKKNTYHMIPGQTYKKDPTVTMDADSEAAYVRMLVTVSDYSDLLAICKAHGEDFVEEVVLLQNFTDWDANGKWKYYSFTPDTSKDTATYEFRYDGTPDGKTKLPALFTKITVPGYMTNDDLKALSVNYKYANGVVIEGDTDKFEINVTAHAIQAAGFDTADEAWKAFDEQTKN